MLLEDDAHSAYFGDRRSFASFDALSGAFPDLVYVPAFRIADGDWRALMSRGVTREHGLITNFLKELWVLWELANAAFVKSLRRHDLIVHGLGPETVSDYVVFESDVSDLNTEAPPQTLVLRDLHGRVLGTYVVAAEGRNIIMDGAFGIFDENWRLRHVLAGIEVELYHREWWQAVGHGLSLLTSFNDALPLFLTFLFEVPDGSARGEFKALAYECSRLRNGSLIVRVLDFGTIDYMDRRHNETVQKILALWRHFGITRVYGIRFLPDGATLGTATSFTITNRLLDNDRDGTMKQSLVDAFTNSVAPQNDELQALFSYTIDASCLRVPGLNIDDPTPLKIPLCPLLHIYSSKNPR